jgi:hypothetical protein
MAHKARVIQYTKRDGSPRLEYWCVDDSGTIRTCSPGRWHRVDLPDHTPLERLEKCAEMRLRATRWTQFNRQVDDNATMRQWREHGETATLVRLCEHHGITV